MSDLSQPVTTAAESIGCCLAQSKEECTRPPCPCNLDTYSRVELQALRKASAHRVPGTTRTV